MTINIRHLDGSESSMDLFVNISIDDIYNFTKDHFLLDEFKLEHEGEELTIDMLYNEMNIQVVISNRMKAENELKSRNIDITNSSYLLRSYNNPIILKLFLDLEYKTLRYHSIITDIIKDNNMECLIILTDKGIITEKSLVDSIIYDKVNIFKYLSSYIEVKDELLVTAALFNRYEIIKYILESTSVDINHINNSGHTALLTAASNDNIEITKLLIKYKADKSIKNNDGFSAKDLSLFNEFEEIDNML